MNALKNRGIHNGINLFSMEFEDPVMTRKYQVAKADEFMTSIRVWASLFILFEILHSLYDPHSFTSKGTVVIVYDWVDKIMIIFLAILPLKFLSTSKRSNLIASIVILEVIILTLFPQLEHDTFIDSYLLSIKFLVFTLIGVTLLNLNVYMNILMWGAAYHITITSFVQLQVNVDENHGRDQVIVSAVVITAVLFGFTQYLLYLVKYCYLLSQRENALARETAKEEILQSKITFMASIAHDTGSVLLCMKSILSTLLETTGMNAQVKEQMLNLEACLTMLTVSRERSMNCIRSSGNAFQNPIYSTMRLTNLLSTLNRCVTMLMARSAVQFKFLIEKDLEDVVVASDFNALLDGLQNYIGNASKYTDVGEIVTSIFFTEDKTGIRLEVSDTGPGISDEMKRMLFVIFGRVETIVAKQKEDAKNKKKEEEETRHNGFFSFVCFWTSPTVHPYVMNDIEQGLETPEVTPRRSVNGTGLGIYGVKMKVVSLGGYVGIKDNVNGKGAVFEMVVPFIPMDVFDSAVAAERIQAFKLAIPPGTVNEMGISYPPPRDASYNAIEFVNKTVSEAPVDEDEEVKFNSSIHRGMVLVVDDSPSIRKYWMYKLKQYHFLPIQAENGEIAFFKMKKYLYSFVIMDMMMPVMDGLQSTRSIRRFETEEMVDTSHKQIIVLSSGGVDDQLERNAYAAGVNHIGKKPCDADAFLIDMIRRFEERGE